MPTVSLKDFALGIQEVWFEELITKRIFPNFRDGLKDSTRSILSAVAKLSDYSIKSIPVSDVVTHVQTRFREGTARVVTKNLCRMSSLPYPLIRTTAKTQGALPGYDRVTGKFPRADYINVSLTPLGLYVLKYRKYFEKYVGSVSDEEKFEYIKTPLPLSLLIPQLNVSDGRSNKAPNLNFAEVIGAFIEHIKKSKLTTTEDLANHIRGFETGKDVSILSTNQALYDLIERGASKAVTIHPVTFLEDVILIRELPYRMTGDTIINQFVELKKLPPKEGGFESFVVTRTRYEGSDEALIVIDIKLNSGRTLEDVRREVYSKTYLQENLVYENFCVDTHSAKPLTIKSVRQVLDYHYDLGIALKKSEVEDRLIALEAARKNAATMEKLTRPFVSELIAQTINKQNKEELVFKYLRNAHKLLTAKVEKILGIKDDEGFDYFEVEHFTSIFANKLINKLGPKATEIEEPLEGDNFDPEAVDNSRSVKIQTLLEEMTPKSFTDEEISTVFDQSKGILYAMNKRVGFLATLRSFVAQRDHISEGLSLDKLREALITEMEDVVRPFSKVRFSNVVYASKYQQRAERKDLQKRVQNHLYKMHRELPVNIIISEDMIAYKSIDPLGTSRVVNPKYMFEVTTMDMLVVVNKNANSYKISVNDIPFDGLRLSESKDNLFVLVDHYDHLLHLFITNQGRCLVTNSNLFTFRNKKLDMSIEFEERIVYHGSFPSELYSPKISILIKTENNEMKKMELTEFKIKDNLKGFFTLFNGSSRTEKINSACLVPTVSTGVDVWEPNAIRNIVYENTKVFKRNVSYGYVLPNVQLGSLFVYDKIPHYKGKFIVDLNQLLDRKLGVNTLSNVFSEIDVAVELQRAEAKEVHWAIYEKSMRRNNLKLPFVPDNHQVDFFIRSNSGSKTRQLAREEHL